MTERYLGPSSTHSQTDLYSDTVRNGPAAAPGLDPEQLEEQLADEIAALLEHADRFEQNGRRYGVETEYPLITDELTVAPGIQRDRLADRLSFTGKEFGAATIELRTRPHDTLDNLAVELGTREAVLRHTTDESGIVPLRYGTHPFITTETFERSHGERYESLSNLLVDNLNPDVYPSFGLNGTDPRDVGVSGMTCSTQVNVQAEGFDDAVEKANHLYAGNPYLIAVSGNARLFEQEDTGYSDIRMPLWEKSCDVRTPDAVRSGKAPKAGKLTSYVEDMDDYLARMDPLYFAPGNEVPALAQAISQYWKDVRIKFGDDTVLVENRPVSTQPTAESDVAAHAYSIGRTAYAQMTDEELLDIDLVNRNRYAAMYNGLDTKLYDRDGDLQDAPEVVRDELDRAAEGLMYLDEHPSRLQPLYDRLETGQIPSDVSATVYHTVRDDTTPETALYEALSVAGE